MQNQELRHIYHEFRFSYCMWVCWGAGGCHRYMIKAHLPDLHISCWQLKQIENQIRQLQAWQNKLQIMSRPQEKARQQFDSQMKKQTIRSAVLFSASELPAWTFSLMVTSCEVDCCSPCSFFEASSAAFAAASCLALSSSIETRRARASSGSRLGSTPKSKPDTPPAAAAAAAAANPLPPSPSPVKIGVLPWRKEHKVQIN